MNISKKFLLIGISMMLAVGLAACNEPGPVEKTGRSIDHATEKAGDKMDGRKMHINKNWRLNAHV